MDWISVFSRQSTWVDPALTAGRVARRDGIFKRGTLYLECNAPTVATGPVLLRIPRDAALDGLLSLQWVPSMGFVFVLTEKGRVQHLNLPFEEVPDRVTLFLTWDSSKSECRLTVDVPDTTTFATATAPFAPRIRLSDAYLMAQSTAPGARGASVHSCAASSHVMPIGPWPSLGDDTLVETPHGDVPIGQLQVGDTVRTYGGDIVPVLHVIRQAVPARGRMRPVTLRGAAFGKDRDIRLAASQRLVIGGVDVREAYGCNAVRITAKDLPAACFATTPTADRGTEVYCQIVLPDGEAFLSDGMAFESLSFAALRRDWSRFALGPLGPCPWHGLPTHPPSAYPLLRPADVQRLTAPQSEQA